MTVRKDASAPQIMAADPRTSVWITANAGSGKTRVLTDRVTRLLLNGVDPANVLCLTFTKAAASEMQNRLFERLGRWAMLEEDDLRAALVGIGAAPDVDLALARTLFARAIDTPGGLRIQTIHAFCATVLRHFPMEAGVSPSFIEIDEQEASRIQAEVLEDLAQRAQESTLRDIAEIFRGEELASLAQEVVRDRSAFPPRADWERTASDFGLPSDLTEDDIGSHLMAGREALLSRVITVMGNGTSAEAARIAPLRGIGRRTTGAEALDRLAATFLTKNEPRRVLSRFATASTAAALGADMDALNAWMADTERAHASRLALGAARATHVLRRFAAEYLPAYDRAKSARGALDFDDLISKCLRLLSDPALGPWVLYKLDGRIDHVLVDEAQDTSEVQWAIIRKITEEIGSGNGTAEAEGKSLFVVGDPKQSIFSFQGANPEAMGEMRSYFQSRMEPEGAFTAIDLSFSFRSSPAILAVVDKTFSAGFDESLGEASAHDVFHEDLPGRVDIWPVQEKSPQPEPDPWFMPVNRVSETHQSIRLARQIADEIRDWTQNEAIQLPNQPARPVRPGDIMVLVQRRSDLFHQIIGSCKAAGLPVAGADRMRVQNEMAARDLMSLMRFVALPEDDLALAEALKSPLFGWNEQELFDLAHHRKQQFLWPELRDRSGEFAETVAVLQDLRNVAEFLRPYDLLERVLIRHRCRERLLAHLGIEADDAIDELLQQAARYETVEAPSLGGFISWFASEDMEVKRQPDTSDDLIQVMTVHGAKGLERPIVVLADTFRSDRRRPRAVLAGHSSGALFDMPSSERRGPLSEAFENQGAAEAAERLRLLYVAMTRAQVWLVVAGARQTSGQNWYDLIAAGVEAAGATDATLSDGTHIRRHFAGSWPMRHGTGEAGGVTRCPLPAWIDGEVGSEAKADLPIAPTALGGEKTAPGAAADPRSLERGQLVHALLEHLPGVAEAERSSFCEKYLSEKAVGREDADFVASRVERLLASPGLASIFDPDALAEVEVSARIAELGGRAIRGKIDRLLVRDDFVLAIDFKTNPIVPETEAAVPEGLLRQMAAYHEALKQIWPERAVSVAILWTETGRLMELPEQVLLPALTRAGQS